MMKKFLMLSVIWGMLISAGIVYAANSTTSTQSSDSAKAEFKNPPQFKNGETPPEPPKDSNGNPMKPPQNGNMGQQRPPMDMNGTPPEPPKDSNGNYMKPPERKTTNSSN